MEVAALAPSGSRSFDGSGHMSPGEKATHTSTSYEADDSMEREMLNMVDELLAPPEAPTTSPQPREETSYGMHSSTANEVFGLQSPSGGSSTAASPGLAKAFPSLPWTYFYNPVLNESGSDATGPLGLSAPQPSSPLPAPGSLRRQTVSRGDEQLGGTAHGGYAVPPQGLGLSANPVPAQSRPFQTLSPHSGTINAAGFEPSAPFMRQHGEQLGASPQLQGHPAFGAHAAFENQASQYVTNRSQPDSQATRSASYPYNGGGPFGSAQPIAC